MINSFKKNKKGIYLMVASSLFVCIGQLFWKIGSDGNIIMLITGFAFYGVGALVMLLAYKYGSLSVLQPMLSMNYIFTIILAYYILHETLGVTKIVGIIIVMIGVVLIGGGDDE